MDSTIESESSDKIKFSIKELIRIFYLEAITKIIYWEESLEYLRSTIFDFDLIIVNLYYVILNAVLSFKWNLSSWNACEKARPFKELSEYLINERPSEKLDIKSIDLKVVILLKN